MVLKVLSCNRAESVSTSVNTTVGMTVCVLCGGIFKIFENWYLYIYKYKEQVYIFSHLEN